MIVSEFIPPVLFVRWHDQCEPIDVDRIRIATEAAYREMGGPVVYVAAIPEDVPPPDAETRAALHAGTEHGRTRFATMHLVLEGDGLKRTVIRSLTAGMMLATGGAFSIHTHVVDALVAARKKVPFDFEDIFLRGRDAGMFGDEHGSSSVSSK
ncbi:MAG: hypothetical protein ACRBN8_05240 [Nannocystales bacterium]